MKNFFGALRHFLFFADHAHWGWVFAIWGIMVVLVILHHLWKDDTGLTKMRIWRTACFLPAAAGLVHFILYTAGSAYTMENYFTLYILCLLTLPWIFGARRRVYFRICAALTGVAGFLVGASFILAVNPYGNFSNMSYTAAFSGMLDELEEHYVLADWKGLDFDELRSEYLPQVQAAEDAQDPVAFGELVRSFVLDVHDGHVVCFIDTPYQKKESTYHEYGLGTVLLGDGSLIAVSTSEDVQALGITDGTVITHWDGQPVQEALDTMPCSIISSVDTNIRFCNALYLGATGGDTVEVTFLDAAGSPRTATLTATGDEPVNVRSLMHAFRRSPQEDENFSVRMLDEHCGYLRLSAEATDSQLNDLLGYIKGVHKPAMAMFREKLDTLAAQGMERLVIDIRGNGGGMDEIALALASQFADEEYFGIGIAVGKVGSCECVCSHNILPTGNYADLPVVVLTDMGCGSAGDGAALYLSKLPNVTLAGITDPGGFNQETGGRCILTGDGIIVSYPAGLVLDETGQPNIDTAADLVSRDPVEVRIPLDKDAAIRMAEGDGDYQLEWAVRFLETAAGQG